MNGDYTRKTNGIFDYTLFITILVVRIRGPCVTYKFGIKGLTMLHV
jgi:hypothetical protein